MPKLSKPVVFFGNERLATGVKTAAPTLQALIKAGYDVWAVVSNYSAHQSHSARELEIQKVTEANKIPILLPDKLLDIKSELEKLKAEVGVLAAYGKIVPQSIIDIFPFGIINIHPSLLPLHRGSTPIESAILNGEIETGVSLMQLGKDMDAGPVFAQSLLKLRGNETKQELADRLLDIGSSMLIELLPQILEGSVIALPQDESKATSDNLISKDDGLIDWAKPAKVLEREIRAFADWPKSQAKIGSQDVIILKARVRPESVEPGKILLDKESLIVGCGQECLEILELQPAGKRPMSAKAFINGYGQKLNLA